MPAVYSLLAVGANGKVAVRMNVGEGAIDQSAEHIVAAPCPELEILAHTADSHCLAVTLRRSSEGGTHPLVRVLAGNAHLGRQSEAPTCSTSMASTAAIASAFSTASGVSIIAINSVCSLRTLQTTACGMAA
jgi:hypothetical protein